MMGFAIAYDPCQNCGKKEMCSMCELTMRRNGAIKDNELSCETEVGQSILIDCLTPIFTITKIIKLSNGEFRIYAETKDTKYGGRIECCMSKEEFLKGARKIDEQ